MDKITPNSSRRIAFIWRFLIVFASAIVASFVIHQIDGKPDPDSATFIARILGGAIAYLGVSLLFTVWIRGTKGVVFGILVVLIMAYLGGYAMYVDHKPERDVIAVINMHNSRLHQIARSTLEQSGEMKIDPQLAREASDDLLKKIKTLDPQTSLIAKIVLSANAEIMAAAEETRKIALEVGAQEFQNPNSSWTNADIDRRLKRLGDFRKSASNRVSLYRNVDLRLKAELTAQKIPPLTSKSVCDEYLKSAHVEIAIPLAQSNIENADILIQRFGILKSYLGMWYVTDGKIVFTNNDALNKWNDNSRLLFQLAEHREALQRRFLAAFENDPE